MDNFLEGLYIGIGIVVGTIGIIVVAILLGALIYYLSLCVSTNIKLKFLYFYLYKNNDNNDSSGNIKINLKY